MGFTGPATRAEEDSVGQRRAAWWTVAEPPKQPQMGSGPRIRCRISLRHPTGFRTGHRTSSGLLCLVFEFSKRESSGLPRPGSMPPRVPAPPVPASGESMRISLVHATTILFKMVLMVELRNFHNPTTLRPYRSTVSYEREDRLFRGRTRAAIAKGIQNDQPS